MRDIATDALMVCLGLNHKTASVETRERFAVGKTKLSAALERLHGLTAVEECVLLSTCNRTEVYFWTSDADAACREILQAFMGNEDAPQACFYRYEEGEALTHLARVAAGLDSMVLGETEIFGQLKDAYFAALDSTHITSGPTSVGAAAVQLAGEALGSLAGARVLVVGAGEVARTTAQSLRSRGAEHIFVANRSYDRAVELASKVGGEVSRFSEWIPYLEQIDIVIVSTSSPVYVVAPPVLEQAMEGRRGRTLFLIDLSVPRNVDPKCALVPNVHLYDIDDMEGMTDETRRVRVAEVEQCESIIAAWVDENVADLSHPQSAIQSGSL